MSEVINSRVSADYKIYENFGKRRRIGDKARRSFLTVVDEKHRDWWCSKLEVEKATGKRVSAIISRDDSNRANFRLGDIVAFEVQGVRTESVITKVNPRRAIVQEKNGVKWRVPYALLKPAGRKNARSGVERLIKVATLAGDLMDRHKLDEWTLIFFESTRALGQCRYRDRLIRLSRNHALDGKIEDISDTILHEIAHAIAGPEAGHGPVWKATARRVGAIPLSVCQL